MSVVVAVAALTLVRPGVIAPAALSTHDAWTSMSPADPVTSWILSLVEASSSIAIS
jgi:hypothetical protein